MADMVLMIPNEDFLMKLWRLMIHMEMMFKLAMGVIDMEDDKVADMVLRIPNEDFTLLLSGCVTENIGT